MKQNILKFLILLLGFPLSGGSLLGQSLKSIEIQRSNGIFIKSFNRFQTPGYPLPLATFLLNDVLKSTGEVPLQNDAAVIDRKIAVSFSLAADFSPGLKGVITFTNISADTVRIGNVVPFGESAKHPYITGKGNHALSRTHLFRPGYEPVNIIVPDNAWELGFATVNVDNGSSVCALTRRNGESIQNALRRRFETEIYPGGSVSYDLWLDSYVGTWQEGLRLMFQDRMLYDVAPGAFNNELFECSELKWIRQAYVGHFVSAWDNHFYSYEKSAYTFPEFQKKMRSLYGGDDYNIIWHGFPMLGMDQRNQWDLFRDLPGGILKMKALSEQAAQNGSSFMTAYKPWDLPAATNQIFNSTRYQDPVQGLAGITREATLRGVMYDTRSESSDLLQKSLEKVRPDFVIFPEGMCTPSAMQNCVVGRVHAALTHAPMLNLNKLIKPDFAIFRQAVITSESVKRDFATSFFNGYGIEIHLKVPYNLIWLNDLYSYLGRTTRILRENTAAFTGGKLVPLLPTTVDHLWVNGWYSDQKTIYTIYSTNPEGYNGPLFEVDPKPGMHFADLWNYREIEPVRIGGKWFVNVSVAGFDPVYAGTENEGENGCVAQLPSLLKISGSPENNNCLVESPAGDKIRLWKGDPSFQKTPVEIRPGKHLLQTLPGFAGYKGKIVIQLFEDNLLLDQRVLGSGDNQPAPSVPFAKSEGKTSYHSGNLSVQLFRQEDLLKIERHRGARVEISPRDLVVDSPLVSTDQPIQIRLLEKFGRYEGDWIIRLYDNQNNLIDHCSVHMPYGFPRISGSPEKTAPAGEMPENMVRVPAGTFRFKAAHIGNWDLKHPMEDTGKVFTMTEFLIDKYPVTNLQYRQFTEQSGYRPADSQNYLKHWAEGKIPVGQENFPVVYISYEDAKAYAAWAGKRLPTEREWQYAAQTADGRLFPWGNEADTTGIRCNPGNGIPDPVGKYPLGENPLGIADLTGSVWQITNDLYQTGVIDYFILKGGCYFTTLSSWWYVKGGPLPLINRQQQYRVSPGYERAATIGFRCVKDLH